MISVGLSVVTFISTYAVLKDRHARLTSDVREHIKDDMTLHARESEAHAKIYAEFETKMNAAFKRIDTLSERLVVLERDTSTHLDMQKAEARFVSHKELQLHMINIEQTLKHTDKEIANMAETLSDLTRMIADNFKGVKNGY